MLRLTDIKLPLDHRPEALKAAILKRLKLPAEALLDWRIFKRAHDARNRNAIFYIYTVDVTLKDESRAPRDARPTPDMDYKFAAHAPRQFQRPLVIGAGPLRPVRRADPGTDRASGPSSWNAARWCASAPRTLGACGAARCSIPNPMSSSAKAVPALFPTASSTARSRIPRYLGRKVLTEFVKAGAPEEILTEAHPHIGTFRLVTMVESMRETIESLGGEYRFQSKVTDLLLRDDRRVRGVRLESGEEIISRSCGAGPGPQRPR